MIPWLRVACLILFLGALVPSLVEARPGKVEVRLASGATAELAVVATDDGTYVAADKLAAALKGTWSVKGGKGVLTVGKRTAEFTRNQRRVQVAGAVLTLEDPPRTLGSGTGKTAWLIPEEFLAKGLPRLAPGAGARSATASAAPRTTKVSSTARGSAAFEELRVRSYPSFTRIVVEMTGPVGYALAADRSEVRVRLMGLQLTAAQEQDIGDGLVKELALEPIPGGARLRIALESAAAQIKDVALLDPHRLVIDVFRPKEQATETAPSGQPLRLIVIDAGHGGHDSGAVGPSGLMEKDVVLDVTRRLAKMVEDGLGVKVILTRKDDTFVPLRDRANMANRQRADIFVSVHANAHPRSVSEGVETYFLSSEASDTEARQTAAIENGVVQLESSASRARADALKSILWELAQSEFQHESSFLAETVLDSMTQSLKMVNRGVKQAGFYVLGGAAMPAILVEIGFLTNPKEERRLASAEHREASARAIYAGLAEYKRRYDQRVRTVQSQPLKAATQR